MGCFCACFGSLKHRQRRPLVNVNHPKDQGDEISEALKLIESTKQETSAKPITLLRCRDKLEEPLDCSPKKRVTFDLNVQICEEKTVEKSTENPMKNNEKKEETPEKIKSVFNPTTPNVILYPPNHRYQNCANSEDDDYEDLGSEGSDIDDVYDDIYNEDVGSDRKQIFVQQESSESLFSLSIDSRRKQVCEVELGNEKEVSSPIPVCSSKNQEPEKSELNQEARDKKKNEYAHSVLKPVENLTQWKLVKAKGRTPMASINQEKENLDTLQNSKQETRKVVDQGIAVDTSLSSWLVESETTPKSKSSSNVSVGNSPMEKEKSVKICEDRVILEELRMEEVKELSVFTSPIGSKSCSSDEPVMGTVGSYWRHKRNVIDSDSSSSVSRGMPKTRNISGKDDQAKCHLTTPFEARLERTLNTSIAEA